MGRFLVKKDSYIDIKRDVIDGKAYITVTTEQRQEYKDGDMLRTKSGCLLIFKDTRHIDGTEMATDHVFIWSCGSVGYNDSTSSCAMKNIDGYCTPEEEKLIHDRLKKDGKRWNADKKCVEDIPDEPQHKFKVGDKVRIKEGISSKTSGNIMYFNPKMDSLIGKPIAVKSIGTWGGKPIINTVDSWMFLEDWLEPWEDEIKVGDTVIAWEAYGLDYKMAIIGMVNQIGAGGDQFYVSCLWYKKAIKRDGTIEQFEKVRRGEL